MQTIITLGLAVLFLFDIVSTGREVLRWRAIESASQRKGILRRRIAIHLGFYVLVIAVFFAIVYFGPLRPVHEWIR